MHEPASICSRFDNALSTYQGIVVVRASHQSWSRHLMLKTKMRSAYHKCCGFAVTRAIRQVYLKPLSKSCMCQSHLSYPILLNELQWWFVNINTLLSSDRETDTGLQRTDWGKNQVGMSVCPFCGRIPY